MTSSNLIEQKNLEDLIFLLIKGGYGDYNTVISLPIHTILRHSKMVSEQKQKELKAKQEYDFNLMKAFRCPLTYKK
jgi:hypothetical protein